MKTKSICTDDHIMVGEHRCEICNCKPYEHAWWSGWDAIVEEPENDEEVAEAEKEISKRIPLKTKDVKMKIKCVVACKNSEGAPDFYPCTVNCSKSQYDNGDHYDMAEGRATDNDYEGPMVVYDEKDGQSWLFNHFFSKQSDTKKAR